MARLRKGETVGWPVGGPALIADLQGRMDRRRQAANAAPALRCGPTGDGGETPEPRAGVKVCDPGRARCLWVGVTLSRHCERQRSNPD
jgi:hypothetical protein